MADWRIFEIEGMTCDHCAATVGSALREVAGVVSVEASFAERRAWVRAPESVTDSALLLALRAKGYGGRRVVPSSSNSGGTRPSSNYDLAVIGSGGAAFGAALKASELGARVAMIERSTLGGTCVNVGCIPSKTLIRAAEALHRAAKSPFAGIATQGRLESFRQVMAQKDALVASLRQAKYADVLGSLPNVDFVTGHAELLTRNVIQVDGSKLHADRVIIATGARPHAPEIPGLGSAEYLTSTGALELQELPRSMLVLGGRYIALELAQMFARMGTSVTIVQRSHHILPTEDDDLTEELAGHLRQEGIEILTDAYVQEVLGRDGNGHAIEAVVGGERRRLGGEKLLVAMGRRPNSDGMGLDRVGVRLDPHGAVAVDDELQTSVPGIYAAGDVIGDPAFVYTAAYEGRLAAENALGSAASRRDYTALPWVMFTDPQVAVVGLNERRARESGAAVDVVKLPMALVPRAMAARDTRGFIKLLKERGGDRLLGAAILAPEAGDLIMEPALAIRHGISVADLASAFHPYLTQAEGIKLAAQAFTKDVRKMSCCAA